MREAAGDAIEAKFPEIVFHACEGPFARSATGTARARMNPAHAMSRRDATS
jgi:hypothetical protein